MSHPKSALVLVVFALAATGCDATPPAPTGTSAKPATSGAPVKASAATPTPTAATAEPAAEDALKEMDLSSVGAAWKGFKIQAPEGTVTADDSAGGISVAMKGGLQVSISGGPALVKDIKDGAEAGAKLGEGTVKFTTDTADALDYVMEIKDPEGKVKKAWGFAMNVDVGGKKYGCSAAGIFEEKDVTKAKDVCKSLKK